MLLDYSFSNFCSFKENVEFSLRSTEKIKDKFPDNYIPGVVDTLKVAVIVGENAGGKSNFVKSLSFLKWLFATNRMAVSIKEYVNDSCVLNPKIKYCDTIQRFSFSVLIDEAVYLYALEIDTLGVKSERLSQINNNEQIEFFEVTRYEGGIDYNGSIFRNNEVDAPHIELKYAIKVKNVPQNIADFFGNTLSSGNTPGIFISKFALLGFKPAVAVCNWVNDTLYPETAPYGAYEIQQNERMSLENLRIMNDKNFISILRMIDNSIIGIKVDKKMPYLNTVIIRKDSVGNVFHRDLMADSAGVRNFFAWAVQIYKVVYQNKVLFADEMDRSLNPVLSDKIISFIHGSKHKGQFIFTTHNVLHLNLSTYMKEQIYFVTKNQETLQSDLYSLSDFDDIGYKEKENIYEFYMKGVLGGTGCG